MAGQVGDADEMICISGNQGEIVHQSGRCYDDICVTDQRSLSMKVGVYFGGLNNNFVSYRIQLAAITPVFK